MLLVLLDNLVTELIGTLTGRQHYEPCLTFFVDRVRPLICCKTPRVLFGLLMGRLCSLVKLTVFVVSLAEFGDNICDFLLFLEHTLILWVYLHLLSSMLDGVFNSIFKWKPPGLPQKPSEAIREPMKPYEKHKNDKFKALRAGVYIFYKNP